jgi:hypothetical protein
MVLAPKSINESEIRSKPIEADRLLPNQSIIITRMEITTLTASIAPFLPFLLNLDNKTPESAAFSKAQAIWKILGSKVEAKPTAQEAAIDLAKNPNDKDLQATLRVQLKKLLDQDAELSKAIVTHIQAEIKILAIIC